MTRPTIIAPEGDLDIGTVDEFRAELLDAVNTVPGAIVIDLTAVDFIDSTGLGAVVDAHNRLRREERPVAVVAPPGSSAALILNLSGLRSDLPVYESRQAALDL